MRRPVHLQLVEIDVYRPVVGPGLDRRALYRGQLGGGREGLVGCAGVFRAGEALNEAHEVGEVDVDDFRRDGVDDDGISWSRRGFSDLMRILADAERSWARALKLELSSPGVVMGRRRVSGIHGEREREGDGRS